MSSRNSPSCLSIACNVPVLSSSLGLRTDELVPSRLASIGQICPIVNLGSQGDQVKGGQSGLGFSNSLEPG
jgi:hypothetical protein